MTSPESSPRNSTGSAFQKVADTLYLAALFAAALFLLRLPVFPSGDGAVHLYYSHVLDEVLRRQPLYSGFYAVRRLFGPYALDYFALIGLERVVSANLAERIFAALTVLNVGLGFRFLARRLGSNAGLATLLAVPLLLPWELVAGFTNYAVAVGVSLWCLGFWLGLRGPRAAANLAAFTAGLIVLFFSHPVPLLLLIGLCAIDLVLILLERRKRGESPIFSGLVLSLAALGTACLAFTPSILIADKSRVAGDALTIGLRPFVLLELVSGTKVTMFATPALAPLVFALFPVAALLVLRRLWQRWSVSGLRTVDRLALAALLMLGISLLTPDSMNGANYFSVRMWWMFWLVALATVSSAVLDGYIFPVFVVGCLLSALTAYCAATLLPPVVERLAVIDG